MWILTLGEHAYGLVGKDEGVRGDWSSKAELWG